MRTLIFCIILAVSLPYAMDSQTCYHAIYKNVSGQKNSNPPIPQNTPQEVTKNITKQSLKEQFIHCYSMGDTLMIYPVEFHDQSGDIEKIPAPIHLADFKNKVIYLYRDGESEMLQTPMRNNFITENVEVEYNGQRVNTAYNSKQKDVRIKYKTGYPIAMPYPSWDKPATIFEITADYGVNFQLQQIKKESAGCPFPDFSKYKIKSLDDDKGKDKVPHKGQN